MSVRVRQVRRGRRQRVDRVVITLNRNQAGRLAGALGRIEAAGRSDGSGRSLLARLANAGVQPIRQPGSAVYILDPSLEVYERRLSEQPIPR